MPVEVRPLGVACNLKCTYCYQEPIREAGNIRTKYDMNKIFEQIEKRGKKFNLFGGEALLIPKDDLHTFWKYGLEKFGSNGVQTNGSLVDDDHIQMFVDYKVNVGFSIDGPGELNQLRWAGSEEKTIATTAKIIENIKKTKAAGVNVGIIVTLHRLNGSKEALPTLIKFIREMGDIGILGGNLHTLEVDSTMPDQEKNVLTQEENIEAFLTLAQFFSENPDLNWKPFGEVLDVLRGDDRKATCYWQSCDPGDTTAVYGIEGNGSLSNCGRTNKEGIDWYKASEHSYARYISFYYTPDEMGGCQGCRFWVACGGNCPGEAKDNDFRNKTIHCQTIKAYMGYYEDQLIAEGVEPITRSEKLPLIEQIFLNAFSRKQKMGIHQALRILKQREEQASERS